MKLTLFLACIILWANCNAQNENFKKDKQRYVVYEDTGFCFVSSPHNLCTFISSTEKNLEDEFFNKKTSSLQYILMFGNNFDNYFDVDLTLTDTILRHLSGINYLFGPNKFDSIQYYRVTVRLSIPIEKFCYNFFKENNFSEYALQYKNKLMQLYSLTKDRWVLASV